MASESVKAALQAKVREVDAVVEEALKRLTDMDDAGYFAALEAFPDADLLQISAITKLKYSEVQDLSDADRDIHIWW